MSRICGCVGPESESLDLKQVLVDSYPLRRPEPFKDSYYRVGEATMASEGEGSLYRSADGRFLCLVDGNIYHYDRMLKALRERGADVDSSSPAETLFNYYHHEGLKSLRLLRGAFVFAIWHIEEKRLILGRDPFGMKRIYYSRMPRGFLFSSNLTGLARISWFDRKVGSNGLVEYLTFGFISPPHTIYEHTATLSPGQYVTFEKKEATVDSFHPSVPSEWKFQDTRGVTEDELITRMDNLLIDAVRCRLPEGKDVTAYLSGGLDTGLLAAVLKTHTDRRIVALTLGSNDPGCDEVPEARGIAKHLGIDDHLCYYIRKEDFFDAFNALPDVFGQPMADISAIPNYVIAMHAAEKSPLVFAGDGPDGMFGNWDFRPWYYYYKLVPYRLRIPFSKLLDFIDRKFEKGWSTPTRHVSELLAQPEFSWIFHKMLKSFELEQFVGKRVPVDTFWIHRHLAERRDIPLYERLRIAFSIGFVVNGVLHKGSDIHNSFLIDLICPYYDRDLADFVNSLPTKYKIRGYGFGKYLHKQLLYRYLPPEIWDRPKQGFNINFNEFGMDALRSLTDRYLNRKRIAETGLIDTDLAVRCVDEYYGGNARMGPLLWTLLVFEVWRDRFAS